MISPGFLRSINITSLGMAIASLVFFALSYYLRLQRAASIGAGQTYRPRVTYLMGLGALALMAVAMLRPYWGFEDIRVKAQGRDIMAALDVSQSMLAKDASPNRLEFARRKLIDLINLLEQKGAGDRIGIILFAGQGYVYCPLTTDYRVARTFAQSIEPSLIGAAGSDLSLMLQVAGGAAQSVQAQNPMLIILSDGEDLALTSPAAPLNLNIFAIGIGAAEGAPIETSPGTYLKDSQGNMVVTRLRDDLLRPLAKLGGGSYQKASLDDSDLKNILTIFDPDSEAAIRESGNIRSYREIGPYLLWPVLLALLALYASGKQRLLLPVVLGAALLSHPARPANAGPLSEQALYEGYQAYQRGDYEKAEEVFAARNKEAPGDLKALEALGSTEYKLGKFSEAERLFEELTVKGKDGRILYDGFYNLGNSRLSLKDYRRAIQAYEKALKVKENDERAKTNLEIARRLLEQEQTPSASSQSASSQSASSASNPAGSQSSAAASQSQSQQESASTQGSSMSSKGAQSSKESHSNSAQSQNASQANQGGDESHRSEESSAAASSTSGGNPSSGDESSSSPAAAASSGESGQSSSFLSSEGGSFGANSSSASSRSISEQFEIRYSPKQHYDPEELRQEEARAWLNALPDAPVLLMKKGRGKKDSKGQTW